MSNKLSAIDRLIKAAGNQSELARRLKIRPQAVQQWVSTGCIPAERVIACERAVNGKVTRHDLRPDIYPAEDDAA